MTVLIAGGVIGGLKLELILQQIAILVRVFETIS